MDISSSLINIFYISSKSCFFLLYKIFHFIITFIMTIMLLMWFSSSMSSMTSVTMLLMWFSRAVSSVTSVTRILMICMWFSSSMSSMFFLFFSMCSMTPVTAITMRMSMPTNLSSSFGSFMKHFHHCKIASKSNNSSN